MNTSSKFAGAAGALASLALTLAPTAEAQAKNPAQRYQQLEVSYNFPPGKRHVMIDCETLTTKTDPATGKIGYIPRVSFAAQFDQLPSKPDLLRLRAMTPAQREAEYVRMELPKSERHIFASVLSLPVAQQDSFYLARNNQNEASGSNKAMFDYVVAHVQGAHGVTMQDIQRGAKACTSYHYGTPTVNR